MSANQERRKWVMSIEQPENRERGPDAQHRVVVDAAPLDVPGTQIRPVAPNVGADNANCSNSRGIGGHHSARAKKDEWLTPPEIIESLGVFDLDPCSPIERPWDMAANHYTIEDDGLSQPWHGRVWCNPPYGRETGKWLNKCAEHGNATALIFARTETADWQSHVWSKAHSVLFLFGRLYFYHVTGERAANNSGAPSALVAFDRENGIALERSELPGKIVRLSNE